MEDKIQEIRYLEQELQKIGLQPKEQQLLQLYQYYEWVIERNKVMNLTAITEYEEFVKKHFVDSLMIARKTKFSGESRLIDIGTGAGFPGIPIKIIYPEVEVVLLDSLKKRIGFLQEVIQALELTQITAIHGRAEEPARQKEYREQFDFCVSRAVAQLSVLAEYCLPYVKIGGSFIAYKSGQMEEELTEAEYAIGVLGGKLTELERFSLPGSDIERTLVRILKEKQTPLKYPRSAGKPAKEPLAKRKKS